MLNLGDSLFCTRMHRRIDLRGAGGGAASWLRSSSEVLWQKQLSTIYIKPLDWRPTFHPEEAVFSDDISFYVSKRIIWHEKVVAMRCDLSRAVTPTFSLPKIYNGWQEHILLINFTGFKMISFRPELGATLMFLLPNAHPYHYYYQ